jgi:LPPG:FO 2-phospho-L-lactate transferase
MDEPCFFRHLATESVRYYAESPSSLGDLLLSVLSGGTGTPKLLQGLIQLLHQEKISVIVNTAEDLELSGLYISPDLDTVLYTLAGVVNEETWYGIHGDTFEHHEELRRQGKPELLRIGDRDREVKRYRTDLLKQGRTLSEATQELCRKFGVRAKVMPMSDDRVQTCVYTEAGPMTFHEFWVARRARDRVTGVRFEGIESARAATGVVNSIRKSDAVIIGPSNPVTSIGPIVAVREIREALIRNRGKVLAVSPIVGGMPVSGPAGALMRGTGHEVSALGVARIYEDFVSTLMIDKRDAGLKGDIERLGVRAVLEDILMPDLRERKRLAGRVLEVISACR